MAQSQRTNESLAAPTVMSRRNFLRLCGGAAVGGVSTGAYAVGVEPLQAPGVTTHRVISKDWRGRAPMRIAAIADPHVCEPFMGLDRLEAIVQRTNALNPDLIVMLGDYAENDTLFSRRVAIEDIASVLSGLRAPLGRYAVMGNHDWWDDAEAQAGREGPIAAHRAFEAAGVPVLENDVLKLDWDGGAFSLAGLGDQWAFRNPLRGVDDLSSVLAQLDDDTPTIMMAHEPDIFAKTPDRIFLTLAGHTHGGQVRLGGWAPVVPSRFGSKYVYGHIQEGERNLVVSAGLGCSKFPVRLGVPPEIVMVEVSGPSEDAAV